MSWTDARVCRRPAALMAAAVLVLLGGCAELPLDNEAPTAPILTSDGIFVTNLGVKINVLVDDADGDRVTLHFTANTTTGTVDFLWTSFIESGVSGEFYLGLPTGEVTLTALARDELEDTSPPGTLTFTVQAQ